MYQAVVNRLVQSADIEIIPLRSADEKLTAVPMDMTITVTTSTKLGQERTLEYAALAARRGYRVIPHLAARQILDEDQLREFVGRLRRSGITEVYVIGGDAHEPAGGYSSATELLEVLTEIEPDFDSIGVACYPEGHPSISDDALLGALRAKQPMVDYMVSQICFDARVLLDWLYRVRSDGITLPLHVCVAAPMDVRKLASLSVKLGVGSSVRYMTKQHGLISKLLPGSTYRPEEFLLDMTRARSFDDLGIERLHLFSFNQVRETVQWQRRLINRTGAVPSNDGKPEFNQDSVESQRVD
jgi:methylenetetrahydrofolate reductase (NADPH)